MTERSGFSTAGGVRQARKDHYGRNEHPGYNSFNKGQNNVTKSSVPNARRTKKTSKKNPQYGEPINLLSNE